MSSTILREDSSIDAFFDIVETETLALFEHLQFEFLTEFDVFAPPGTNTGTLSAGSVSRLSALLLQGHLRHPPGCTRTQQRPRLARM